MNSDDLTDANTKLPKTPGGFPKQLFEKFALPQGLTTARCLQLSRTPRETVVETGTYIPADTMGNSKELRIVGIPTADSLLLGVM